MKIPPYLKMGDTVGICCPSGALQMEKVQPMVAQLEFWGFNVVLGKTVGTQYNKFSGTDEERLLDLQSMLDDDNIHAILFGRGGYGLVRIIDAIDFSHFILNPKWLVGFSDITVLHNHVHSHYGIATIHAHMSGGYLADNFDNESTMSIYHTLTGKPHEYIIETDTENEVSYAHGILVGGNLALLSDLIGTRSDIDTKKKILLIEDVGEYTYNIDRMLWQLLRAGKLHALAGLIVGGFTEIKKDDTPMLLNENELIWEKVSGFNYPICFGFPVGHQPKNVALKLGVEYELIVEKNRIIVREILSSTA